MTQQTWGWEPSQLLVWKIKMTDVMRVGDFLFVLFSSLHVVSSFLTLIWSHELISFHIWLHTDYFFFTFYFILFCVFGVTHINCVYLFPVICRLPLFKLFLEGFYRISPSHFPANFIFVSFMKFHVCVNKQTKAPAAHLSEQDEALLSFLPFFICSFFFCFSAVNVHDVWDCCCFSCKRKKKKRTGEWDRPRGRVVCGAKSAFCLVWTSF